MATFLETKRLILKPTKLADLNNLIVLRSDPDVMKFVGEGKIQNKEEVKRFLKIAIDNQKKYGYGFCSVFEKDSGDFIGQAGLFHLGFNDEQPEIEIAYRLHKQYWGKGYATELVIALIQWGFEHLPNKRLIALVDTENLRSRKVLEKAGMRYTGKVIYSDKEMPCYEIYKNDAIELSAYNTQWPKMAKSEIKKLRQLFHKQNIIDIQHVGSTAIPGIPAKPIIDIQIAVASLEKIKPMAIEQLKTLGYVYWDANPDPTRLFFAKGMPPFGEKRSHHLHIVEPHSHHWREKLLFRDYLIAHTDIAQQYADLKKQLAMQYLYQREKYTEAKTDFIKKIIERASQVKHHKDKSK